MTNTATDAKPVETLIIETPVIDELIIQDWISRAQDWFNTYFLSLNTAIQFGIVIGAFVLGAMFDKMVRPRLVRMVDKWRLSGQIHGLLRNLVRLVGPFLALVFMFLALMVAGTAGTDIDWIFLDAVMRLTAAWIIIRLAVQMVHNPMARNTIAAVVWVLAALSIFGVLDDTAKALDSLGISFGDFRLTALIVVKCIIATLVLLYIATTLSRFVERQLGKVPNLSPGSLVLVTKLTRMVFSAIAIIIGIGMAGIDLSVLTVFSGAIGLGVGFGLQRGVSNLFTGIMLLADKTVQPGDIIEIQNGAFGIVRQMGSRCTELVTLDKKAHLIPNEDLVTKPVINWSRAGGRSVLSVKFRVDYRHNPHEIIEMAKTVAAAHPRVLQDPGPGCGLENFGDHGLEFGLGFWINDPQNGTGNVQNDIRLALWDAFQQNNIIIPYPHQVQVEEHK